MSERDHTVELIEDGGINPEARDMDVERPEDKLPPASPEYVFRNIETGLEEIRNALIAGNRIRAKAQFASVKTLISMGTSAAIARKDEVLKQRLSGYYETLDELNTHLLNGTVPPSIIKYCSGCGTVVEVGDTFCSGCGTPQ